MNLEKAIEILGFIKQDRIPVGELDELKALNLGIEALKRVEAHRASSLLNAHILLQGETED